MIIKGSATEYLDEITKNDTAWFVDVDRDSNVVRTIKVNVSTIGTFIDDINGVTLEVVYALVVECETKRPHLSKLFSGGIPQLYSTRQAAECAALVIKLMRS